MPADTKTAEAFASSWNNLPPGSVYTPAQFIDWFEPIQKSDIFGKEVLELGCGNASLAVHILGWKPNRLEAVDLGSSVKSAEANLSSTGFSNWKVVQADLIDYRSSGFDVVYCIGVLHHLAVPSAGFNSVIRNTRPGGRFHCWVYAREGNRLIISVVDPLRKIASKLPWFITKYFIASALVIPFFFYAKLLAFFSHIQRIKRTWLSGLLRKLPLCSYSLWIAERSFPFFLHVAFDQLVTPQTDYISKDKICAWLEKYPQIEKNSVYIIFRNGNSWKFGGRISRDCGNPK